jgi:hypothetical protein
MYVSDNGPTAPEFELLSKLGRHTRSLSALSPMHFTVPLYSTSTRLCHFAECRNVKQHMPLRLRCIMLQSRCRSVCLCSCMPRLRCFDECGSRAHDCCGGRSSCDACCMLHHAVHAALRCSVQHCIQEFEREVLVYAAVTMNEADKARLLAKYPLDALFSRLSADPGSDLSYPRAPLRHPLSTKYP